MKCEGDRHSLGVKVFEELKNDILNLNYLSGDTLVENSLCMKYNVSRTPVREALKQLEQEGLISVVPNKSAVVVGISDEDIIDIFDIRIRLEGLAAAKAAKNIDDKEIDDLKESLDILSSHIEEGNFENIGSIDTKFHDVIYRASKSSPLRTILHNFHHYTKMARTRSFKGPNRAMATISEHKAIFDAICNHDSELAMKLSVEHVEHAKNNYLHMLEVDRECLKK